MKKCIINICFVSLLACSCFYIWQIYHVPDGLELRAWFRVNLGCGLIVFWQIVIIVVFLFCGSIVLYLAWTFVKISIVNDKDVVNETGTLTVYFVCIKNYISFSDWSGCLNRGVCYGFFTSPRAYCYEIWNKDGSECS